jgi:hypothetical protein
VSTTHLTFFVFFFLVSTSAQSFIPGFQHTHASINSEYFELYNMGVCLLKAIHVLNPTGVRSPHATLSQATRSHFLVLTCFFFCRSSHRSALPPPKSRCRCQRLQLPAKVLQHNNVPPQHNCRRMLWFFFATRCCTILSAFLVFFCLRCVNCLNRLAPMLPLLTSTTPTATTTNAASTRKRAVDTKQSKGGRPVSRLFYR